MNEFNNLLSLGVVGIVGLLMVSGLFLTYFEISHWVPWRWLSLREKLERVFIFAVLVSCTVIFVSMARQMF